MRARLFFCLAILALPLLQGGCATRATLDAMSPIKHITDTVEDVTHAFRKRNGDALICVTGRPGEADSKKPMQRFSILFPAGAFSDAVRAAPELEESDGTASMMTFHVTTQAIQGPCPETDSGPAGGWTPVPVQTVRETDFGFAYFNGDLRDAPRRYFNDRPATPTVYRFLSGSGCRVDDRIDIVYVHDKAAFAGEHAVHISSGYREIEGEKNYAYAVFLPVTVAVDIAATVVAFPFFLVMLAITGGNVH